MTGRQLGSPKKAPTTSLLTGRSETLECKPPEAEIEPSPGGAAFRDCSEDNAAVDATQYSLPARTPVCRVLHERRHGGKLENVAVIRCAELAHRPVGGSNEGSTCAPRRRQFERRGRGAPAGPHMFSLFFHKVVKRPRRSSVTGATQAPAPDSLASVANSSRRGAARKSACYKGAMPHTRSRSSSKAQVGGMGRRAGSARAAGKATSRQHSASCLKLKADDVRVTPRTAPVSVMYMRQLRLHIGNPSVPATPSSDPPQNSARKSAPPLDWAVGMDSCPCMSRARAVRVECLSSCTLEKCKKEKSTWTATRNQKTTIGTLPEEWSLADDDEAPLVRGFRPHDCCAGWSSTFFAQ